MATVAPDTNHPGDPHNYRIDQGFFLGLSLALSLLIVVGFAQLALRGITNPVDFPLRVHIHALLLLSWLGLFSYQNWLAYKGELARHRMLGKAATVLVPAIVVANFYTFIMTLVDGRLGPNFTPGYFIALGTADTLFFAGLVAWALMRRRDVQWHRRLMFGATLILAAAGINRIVGASSDSLAEAASIAWQLAFLVVLAWHDKRLLGHVHIATALLVPIVIVERILPHVAGSFPAVMGLAESLVG